MAINKSAANAWSEWLQNVVDGIFEFLTGEARKQISDLDQAIDEQKRLKRHLDDESDANHD